MMKEITAYLLPTSMPEEPYRAWQYDLSKRVKASTLPSREQTNAIIYTDFIDAFMNNENDY